MEKGRLSLLEIHILFYRKTFWCNHALLSRVPDFFSQIRKFTFKRLKEGNFNQKVILLKKVSITESTEAPPSGSQATLATPSDVRVNTQLSDGNWLKVKWQS